MFGQEPQYIRPDWAQQKEGEPTLMKPGKLDWLLSVLSADYHRGCGGYYREKGHEGLFAPKIWMRCDRCGAQAYVRLEP
jgi:hypothetical protein